MANCNVHLGDSLTVNVDYLDCAGAALNINGASTQQVILKGPTTRFVVSSSYVTDGTDGKVTATVDAGEIDETGTWQIQGRVVISGSPDLEYHSEIETFEVDGNL